MEVQVVLGVQEIQDALAVLGVLEPQAHQVMAAGPGNVILLKHRTIY